MAAWMCKRPKSNQLQVMSILTRVLNPKGLLLPITLLLGIPAILWLVQSVDRVGTVENTLLLVARAAWPLLPPLGIIARLPAAAKSLGHGKTLINIKFKSVRVHPCCSAS
jgi:hypothetical protein